MINIRSSLISIAGIIFLGGCMPSSPETKQVLIQQLSGYQAGVEQWQAFLICWEQKNK